MTMERGVTAPFLPSWPRAPLRPLRRLLRLSLDQALFEARGFAACPSPRRLALEAVGATFIGGYNAALAADTIDEVLRHIAAFAPAQRGFAAEGAAMGVAVADALPFRKPRLDAYLRAVAGEFTYLAHVGAGWALARVPWRRRHILAALDPVHHWLAFDGLGFHDAYFFHRRILAGWRRQRTGYAAKAYDQGVGRALWFVAGACAQEVTRLIAAFPAARQRDLWSGLGLAMAYAGPASPADIVSAHRAADAHAGLFAQGVAFACEARARAGYVPEHTELAARAVSGIDAGSLAQWVRAARARLPADETDPPRYELWRCSVASALPTQDHDDFGSSRSKIINVIDSHSLEHDVVRKPLRTFRHHALGAPP